MQMGCNAALGFFLLASAWPACAQVSDPPLVQAAKDGDSRKVRLLLEQHADPNTAAKDGSTALLWAVQKDHLEIANLLIGAGANAKTGNRYGAAAISLACTNGNAAMVDALLSAGVDANTANPEGETALMTCARSGSVAAVASLVKHGANVNALEKWRGQSALMWAAAEGHSEVVKALLQAGADTHARAKGPPARPNPNQDPNQPKRRANPTDFTALLLAVREGHMETVRTLLDAGGDANEALSDGQTALHLAALNAQYDIGLLLLDHGANANASGCGWTALHQIAWTRRPNIHKTPAAIGTGKMESLEFTKILVAHGADVNARESKEPIDGNLGKLKRVGATAFLLAAKSGDYEFMRFLGGLGADARLMTSENVTPLETAAGIGIYRVAESPGSNEDSFECVKAAYELAHGDPAYVNHIDNNGRTALHGAAFRGSPEIVQFLFDHGAGATIDRKDFLGWTALTIAEGVLWPTVLKTELPTAALLVKLGAKHEDVPEEVRILGMATQGVDNGLDQTMGGGGAGEGAPAAAAKPAAKTAGDPDTIETAAGAVCLKPLRNASVLIQAGGRNIYIDPAEGNYDNLPPADLILVTSDRPGHLAPAVIAKIRKKDTVIVGPAAISPGVAGVDALANGGTRTWGDWSVESVPAYNRIRGDEAGHVYQAKGRGNGYVLTYGGKRFYFSGDTEDLPEMAGLKQIDVAFICMNLPYAMTPEEAALAVQRFHPAIVYPYDAKGANLNSFVAYTKGTKIDVRVRDWYPKN